MSIVPPGKFLRPIQKRSLKQLLATDGNAFLCDKPGDGKTVTAISYMNARRIKTALIVCKSTGVEVWKRHLKEWHTMNPVVEPYHPEEPFFHVDILLCTYHWLSYKEVGSMLFHYFPYELCILDEPHVIRSVNSMRAKQLFAPNGLAKKSKKTIGLTGTLLFSKPIGLFPLVAGLTRKALGPYRTQHEFGMKFCGGYWDHDKEQYNYDGASNIGLLRKILENQIVENSNRTDNLNLADPEIAYLEPNKKSKKLVEVFDKDFTPVKYSKHKDKNVDDDIEVATLRRELGETKMPQTLTILKKEILKFKKVLVFAYHRSVVKGVAEKLGAFVDTKYLVGGMAKTRVTKTVDWFNTTEDPAALCLSVTGFNDTVTLPCLRPIFIEMSYIWNENYQAIMRTRPEMRDKKVRPLFIMYKESYDERLLEINFNNVKIQKEFNK